MSGDIVIRVTPIPVSLDVDGAKVVLAHLAKPTNPRAALNKLENWLRLADPNASTKNRRSRRQVEAGILDVWRGLRTAVAIGDRRDQAMAHHEGAWRTDPKLASYARPLSEDPPEQWKNYIPLSHAASAFRIALIKRKQLRTFDLSQTDDARLDAVWRLLVRDTSWLGLFLVEAQQRAEVPLLWSIFQPPAHILQFELARSGPPLDVAND